MQLEMNMGAKSGTEKVEPFATGDIIVKHDSRRLVIESVSDNIHGLVFICIALDNGATCTVLEREVAYRSR